MLIYMSLHKTACKGSESFSHAQINRRKYAIFSTRSDKMQKILIFFYKIFCGMRKKQ
jgi:hypothetical protein